MNLDKPDENGKFAEQLEAKGLRPVSMYTGARVHEAGKASESVKKILAAARVCKDAGFQVISCNADPIGREKTDEELKGIFMDIAPLCKDSHGHTGEVPENLNHLADVVWLRNMIEFVDDQLKFMMSNQTTPEGDDCPF